MKAQEKAKDFQILGHTIKPGKSLQANLDIAKLHTRTKIEVPIIIEHGKFKGPVILITWRNSWR